MALRIPLPYWEIIDLYKAGLSISQLAERYSVSYTTMHRALTEADVSLRPRGQALGSNRLSHREFEVTAELYEAGWTTYEIADKLGLSRKAIRHRLQRAGVKMRPPGYRTTKPHTSGAPSPGVHAPHRVGTP